MMFSHVDVRVCVIVYLSWYILTRRLKKDPWPKRFHNHEVHRKNDVLGALSFAL